MNKKHDIRINRKLLHPWLNFKLTKLLDACEKKGIYLIVTEGFRTKAYQDELYAKGRTKPGKIVTNAKGSTYSSQHMWGIAFDIAINDNKLLYDHATIKKVADIAKSSSIGLGWGGDWKSFQDTPHFYLKKWGSTTSTLKQQYGTPSEFKKTWKKTVNIEKGLKIWKYSTKLGGYYKCVPYGKKVNAMFTKSWYVKVLVNDEHAGYMNKKYLK